MTLRSILIALACTAALSLPLHAQTPIITTDSSRISDVGFFAWNNGIFSLDPVAPRTSFIYPRGSNHGYIYGGGLWFGAVKEVGGTPRQLAFIAYNPNSGIGWGAPEDPDFPSSEAVAPISWSSLVDRSTGASHISVRPAWPLWLEPGDRVSILHPGRWVRDTSLRHPAGLWLPAFVPGVQEQAVIRYHDNHLANYEFGAEKAAAYGYPLGLQVHQNLYAWSDGPLSASVLVQYEIVNIGSSLLTNCYVGQLTDMDIGKGPNDHFAWFDGDPSLRTAIAWTDNTAGDDASYRTLAMTLLETPTVGFDGRPDNTVRAPLSGQVPIHAARPITIEQDARKPEEWYNLLSTSYLAQDNMSADQRGIMSAGPFTFAPGDTAHFAILYSIVDVTWPFSAEDVDAIRNHVLGARDFYYTEAASAAPLELPGMTTAIEAVPNPTSGMTTIRGTIPGISAELSVTDALGRSAMPARRIEVNGGRFAAPVDLSELAAGTYVVTIRGGGIVRSVMVRSAGR